MKNKYMTYTIGTIATNRNFFAWCISYRYFLTTNTRKLFIKKGLMLSLAGRHPESSYFELCYVDMGLVLLGER